MLPVCSLEGSKPGHDGRCSEGDFRLLCIWHDLDDFFPNEEGIQGRSSRKELPSIYCYYIRLILSEKQQFYSQSFIKSKVHMQITPGGPQRSKSFKALSMAQPIRKDIEQTLNQLQQQKRRYLASDREQNLLKQQLERKRTQLILLKKQIPVTQTDQKRATQTNLKLKNTDRTYESTIGSIQKTKQEIDTIRKRIAKLKIYNSQLHADQQQLTSDIDKLVEEIVVKQRENEDLKQEIVNYREQNIKNLKEFEKSHMNLTKSNFKDENQRRKFAVSTRTFLGQEQRKSRIVHYDKISDILRGSGIVTNEGKADILADSIPIAKSRVNVIIHQNKQKIRIAQNYMKFGQGLQNLFNIIKQYKGRDDVDYIADQFVKKQRQIQKLGEYIGKLEYQIVSSKRQLAKKADIESELQNKLTSDNHNISQRHYKQMTVLVKDQVAQLKAQHIKMNDWLKQVAEILCPLAGDDDFSRGNAANVMGKLEQKLGINRAQVGERKNQSPSKANPAPPVQPDDHYQKYAELLSYEKMREYADEYIKGKKN